ncbi:hypothetical protein Purlil1_12021 [Purpureocillium lilacinum]|uniref:Uncharacterized protein n=1 Tax=Purpureocillium lilacinum TaxID=33203 RepID=A0ABR0BHZ1_PURLI|nr:hypothetical protein Purlil1_12021 [Purpureocillium lilacinum]
MRRALTPVYYLAEPALQPRPPPPAASAVAPVRAPWTPSRIRARHPGPPSHDPASLRSRHLQTQHDFNHLRAIRTARQACEQGLRALTRASRPFPFPFTLRRRPSRPGSTCAPQTFPHHQTQTNDTNRRPSAIATSSRASGQQPGMCPPTCPSTASKTPDAVFLSVFA